MVVFDILKNVIERDKQRQSKLGLFSVDIADTDEKVFQGKRTRDGYINIKASGNLPSATSIALRKASTASIGYGLGKLVFRNDNTPKNYGHDISEGKSFIILSVSHILGQVFGSYVLDELAGIDVGEIKIAIPYLAEGENILEFKQRAENYAVNAASDLFNPETMKKADKIWEKTQNATITYSVLTALESLANGYHGFKRHDNSMLWALGWAAFGNVGYAIAQGFGEKEYNSCEKNHKQRK